MARPASPQDNGSFPRWIAGAARSLLPVTVAFAFLFALSFLPPDTALREVDRLGQLRVCMPASYPPLVDRQAEHPGFEVELLREVAARSGWRLLPVSNASMGRDFNPRSWRVTRAQCQMLAGGVTLTPTTRSFLETGPAHLRTGWALVAPPGMTLDTLDGPVGFLASVAGFDRIALGQYLRGQGVTTRIVNSADALREGLEDGSFAGGVTEALVAGQAFGDSEWEVTLLPEEVERLVFGFGFWRGDTTFRRHVEAVVAELWEEGFVAELAERYGLIDEFLCGAHGADC